MSVDMFLEYIKKPMPLLRQMLGALPATFGRVETDRLADGKGSATRVATNLAAVSSNAAT